MTDQFVETHLSTLNRFIDLGFQTYRGITTLNKNLDDLYFATILNNFFDFDEFRQIQKDCIYDVYVKNPIQAISGKNTDNILLTDSTINKILQLYQIMSIIVKEKYKKPMDDEESYKEVFKRMKNTFKHKKSNTYIPLFNTIALSEIIKKDTPQTPLIILDNLFDAITSHTCKFLEYPKEKREDIINQTIGLDIDELYLVDLIKEIDSFLIYKYNEDYDGDFQDRIDETCESNSENVAATTQKLITKDEELQFNNLPKKLYDKISECNLKMKAGCINNITNSNKKGSSKISKITAMAYSFDKVSSTLEPSVQSIKILLFGIHNFFKNSENVCKKYLETILTCRLNVIHNSQVQINYDIYYSLLEKLVINYPRNENCDLVSDFNTDKIREILSDINLDLFGESDLEYINNVFKINYQEGNFHKSFINTTKDIILSKYINNECQVDKRYKLIIYESIKENSKQNDDINEMDTWKGYCVVSKHMSTYIKVSDITSIILSKENVKIIEIYHDIVVENSKTLTDENKLDEISKLVYSDPDIIALSKVSPVYNDLIKCYLNMIINNKKRIIKRYMLPFSYKLVLYLSSNELMNNEQYKNIKVPELKKLFEGESILSIFTDNMYKYLFDAFENSFIMNNLILLVPDFIIIYSEVDNIIANKKIDLNSCQVESKMEATIGEFENNLKLETSFSLDKIKLSQTYWEILIRVYTIITTNKEEPIFKSFQDNMELTNDEKVTQKSEINSIIDLNLKEINQIIIEDDNIDNKYKKIDFIKDLIKCIYNNYKEFKLFANTIINVQYEIQTIINQYKQCNIMDIKNQTLINTLSNIILKIPNINERIKLRISELIITFLKVYEKVILSNSTYQYIEKIAKKILNEKYNYHINNLNQNNIILQLKANCLYDKILEELTSNLTISSEILSLIKNYINLIKYSEYIKNIDINMQQIYYRNIILKDSKIIHLLNTNIYYEQMLESKIEKSYNEIINLNKGENISEVFPEILFINMPINKDCKLKYSEINILKLKQKVESDIVKPNTHNYFIELVRIFIEKYNKNFDIENDAIENEIFINSFNNDNCKFTNLTLQYAYKELLKMKENTNILVKDMEISNFWGLACQFYQTSIELHEFELKKTNNYLINNLIYKACMHISTEKEDIINGNEITISRITDLVINSMKIYNIRNLNLHKLIISCKVSKLIMTSNKTKKGHMFSRKTMTRSILLLIFVIIIIFVVIDLVIRKLYSLNLTRLKYNRNIVNH